MSDEFLESLTKAVAAFLLTVSDSPVLGFPNASSADIATAFDKLDDHPMELKSGDEHQGLARIRDFDPTFDIGEFLTRVGQMFSAYHVALDKADLRPARRFVDEGAYADLAKAAQQAGRNPMGTRVITIKAIRPMTASHKDGLDTIRVLITAEASGTENGICEYWELIRKEGTLTKAGLDLTHCPNCGGPVDGVDPTRCAYCGTRLADPALDWVVRKIAAQ